MNGERLDGERWDRVQTLFHEAAARPENEWRAFLEAACSEDSDLMAQVLCMLADDIGTATFLDAGLPALARQFAGSPFASRENEFGPYRLRRLLGEGGMGVVWLAERKDAGNLVAVKFLPHASLSPARRERFAGEIKTLARLRHPFIARLYDAGNLRDGTPWFVMEFVEGKSLSDYLRERDLRVETQLRLFRKVCEAVQYAHGQEIIHRDLKPSNIMVENDGTPRLLDFGIAKQLHNEDDDGDHTRRGLRFLTPDYAAPEWIVDGSIGFGTDVYSLGVILYEMLASRLPYSRNGAGADPAKPSDYVKDANCKTLQSVSRAQRSDLDVLCLKAVHRDPEQRYRSVEALIRDIDHYLSGEPLEARPDTVRYRFTKFVGRNRQAVFAASLALALIAGQLAFFTVRVARARDAAIAEAARTKRIQHFMVNLLDAGDQQSGPSNELRVVSLLDRGAQEAGELKADPETQAELYKTLGTMYQLLGKYPQADRMIQGAVDGMKAARGTGDPAYADTLVQLGLLRGDEARFKEAEQAVREGLNVVARRLPANDPMVVNAQWALGQVLDQSGAYDNAIAVLNPLVRLKPSGDQGSATLADSFTALGYAYHFKGQFDKAVSYHERALALDRGLFGPSHPRVAYDLANIGTAQNAILKKAEAESDYRQALAIMRSWYGPDHPETAQISSFLALALAQQGKYAEAEPLLQQVLAIEEQAKGKNHPYVASVLDTMSKLAINQGKLTDAEADLRRALSIDQAAFGDSLQTASVMEDLGGVLVMEKLYSQAEPLLRVAVKVLMTQPKSGNLNLGVGQVVLGRALLRQKRYREAEQYLTSGYAEFSRNPAQGSKRLREAREDLAELYEATHRPEKAGEFRAELVSAPGRRQ